MTLHSPAWLILLIPMGVLWWRFPLPGGLVRGLRAAGLVLLIVALAGPAVRLEKQQGTLVVLADRSRSMPPRAEARMQESIHLLQRQMPRGDRLSVVAFGAQPAIEHAPQAEAFQSFSVQLDPDASNLSSALHIAQAMIPEDQTGRILVLSDGLSTGEDPLVAAHHAAQRAIPVDYRLLERAFAQDAAIEDVQLPPSVGPREALVLTAWVYSPVPQEMDYRLWRGDAVLAEGRKMFPAGRSPLLFRDRVDAAGTVRYRVEINPTESDAIVENNAADALLAVAGARPILCLRGNPNSRLPELLRKANLTVEAPAPETIDLSLATLAGYSGVVLENLPATKLGTEGMANLTAWVRDAGGGLFMTGGENSYGPGGYYRSPIEPILPVSMELRQEHRKLATAIVVALDRSGSMAASIDGGRTKMQLANEAAAEVYQLLTSMDQFGCIAVDSAPHTIVPLQPANRSSSTLGKIRGIQSQGGGIFVYSALQASVKMLSESKVGTRHIILFADAADAEEPGDYKSLLEQCRAAGVTCSVIGLGTEKDSDADLLKDVAERGNGRCFFTNRASELPRLFAQDTFVVARNSFQKDPTAWGFTAGLTMMTTLPFSDPPPVGGYNLCYLRPRATMAAVTRDEYAAPLLSAWQAGLGRVVCYAGEVDGAFTGPMADWAETGDFLASQTRWVANLDRRLPPEMAVTQTLDDGLCRIRLYLDPQRDGNPWTDRPSVRVLRGEPGRPPRAETRAMEWLTPDTLGLDLSLTGTETVLPTLEIPALATTALAPVRLPYSPEYALRVYRNGRHTLRQLAETTGGTERIDLSSVWSAIPHHSRWLSLTPWFVLVAATVFLLEVFQRRTGLLAAAGPWLRIRRRTTRESSILTKEDTSPRSVKRPLSTPPTASPQSPAQDAPAQPAPDKSSQASPSSKEHRAGLLDALDQARSRARRRNE